MGRPPKTGVIWRLWDLTMINLAVLHGFNGLRQVLYEYVAQASRRRVMASHTAHLDRRGDRS